MPNPLPAACISPPVLSDKLTKAICSRIFKVGLNDYATMLLLCEALSLSLSEVGQARF